MPLPTAPAGWSPPPPTIGVPVFKPVAALPSSETVEETTGLSKHSGRRLESRSSFVKSSRLQRRFATSSRSVPDASLTSVANVPESRNRM